MSDRVRDHTVKEEEVVQLMVASLTPALLQLGPDEFCCGSFSVHCRIFSSGLGLNLLDAKSKPFPYATAKKSPDIGK